MPNRILQVEEIIKRVKAGYPSGVDTESHKQIPILLARIEELEAALVPFARIGATLTNNEPEIRDVYTKDVKAAYEVMDRRLAYGPAPIEDFGIPAHF